MSSKHTPGLSDSSPVHSYAIKSPSTRLNVTFSYVLCVGSDRCGDCAVAPTPPLITAPNKQEVILLECLVVGFFFLLLYLTCLSGVSDCPGFTGTASVPRLRSAVQGVVAVGWRWGGVGGGGCLSSAVVFPQKFLPQLFFPLFFFISFFCRGCLEVTAAVMIWL